MSKYVITGVQIKDGEVEKAHVQPVNPRSGAGNEGTAGLGCGEFLGYADIANLLHRDDVHVVKWIGPGEFELGSRVTCKPGQFERLVSINDDGSPNDDLMKVAAVTPD